MKIAEARGKIVEGKPEEAKQLFLSAALLFQALHPEP